MTWSTQEIDTPANVTAAIIAYYNSEITQAATLLVQTEQEWEELSSSEVANLQLLLGNVGLRHPQRLDDLNPQQYYEDAAQSAATEAALLVGAYNNLGITFLLMSEAVNARSAFDQAEQSDQDYPWTYLNRSLANIESEDLQAAKDDCERLPILLGSHAQLSGVCLARAYFLHAPLETPDDNLLTASEQASQIDSALAQFMAGVGYCHKNDLETAQTHFSRSLELTNDRNLSQLARTQQTTAEFICVGNP